MSLSSFVRSAFVRWSAIVLVAIACLCGLAAIWLRASLPRLDGELASPHLDAPAEILRDGHGVPHIYAKTREGAFYALGVAHAQDRLWQMSFSRAAAHGRLSELLGRPALPIDRLLRALDLESRSRRTLERLLPETRAILTAYAHGVNAVVIAPKTPPPEFLVLGLDPEPWRPEDSLSLLTLVALQLSTNAFSEVQRLGFSGRLPPERFGELFADDPPMGPVALDPADLSAAGVMREAFLDTPARALLPPGASNNWVVDGRFTASGKPLLANDPHLGMTAPGVWYLAHLSYPQGEGIGGTMPGIPALLVGQTRALAWGVTNTGTDVQDLYFEKVHPEDPSLYAGTGEWLPFATREERFRIRFGGEETHIYRATRHGPVIPPGLGPLDAVTPPGTVPALAFTALEDNTTLDVLARALEIESIDTFLPAFERYVAPMQNIVFASATGEIGFLAPGRVPVRGPSHPAEGRLPAPGWDPGAQWRGTVPFAELPQVRNPAKGYVVTANNRIVPRSYPHFLTAEWERPYRARRIEELLTARTDHDVGSFLAIQLDEHSLPAREFLDWLLPLTRPGGRHEEEAVALLAGWDGTMAADRPEPLIFTAWIRALVRDLVADELGPAFRDVWRFDPLFLHTVFLGAGGAWCDDTRTPQAENCTGLPSASLSRALAELRGTHGPDPGGWSWGEAHEVINAHRPFSEVPVLRRFFEIRVPSGGGFFTIDRGGYSFPSRTPYANIHGSGYRAVYDLADPERSVFITATGQSGHPLSPHWRDLADIWAAGGVIPMRMDEAAIRAEAAHRLVLAPL